MWTTEDLIGVAIVAVIYTLALVYGWYRFTAPRGRNSDDAAQYARNTIRARRKQ